MAALSPDRVAPEGASRLPLVQAGVPHRDRPGRWASDARSVVQTGPPAQPDLHADVVGRATQIRDVHRHAVPVEAVPLRHEGRLRKPAPVEATGPGRIVPPTPALLEPALDGVVVGQVEDPKGLLKRAHLGAQPITGAALRPHVPGVAPLDATFARQVAAPRVGLRA